MRALNYISILILSILPIPAHAGSGSGLVHNVYAFINGIIIFTVDTHNDAPPCGSGAFSKDFAFDSTTQEGKNKYALLLIAANSKKRITVTGDSTCRVWGDRETALWFVINF